jgi:predicted small lipoprotein YifL
MQIPRQIGIHSGLAALVLLSLTLGACGLKGPLYSPDERKEAVTSPSSTSKTPIKRRVVFPPAPQSQKEDRLPQTSPPESGEEAAPPVSPPDPDRPATPTTPPPQSR